MDNDDKTILIVSTRADMHANAVVWGLRALGSDPVLWDWSAFPADETASLAIGPDGQAQLCFSAQGREHREPFDTIWWRRPGRPAAPRAAHPDDVPVIEQQSEQFLRAVLPFAGHAGTRWVNPRAAAILAENKARQLVAAREAGFRIPATVMGNAPPAVRAALARHGGQLAHKGFLPMRWDNEDGSRTSGRTAAVGEAQLARDFAIHACPSIYQELLAKQHELRVTVMGRRVLAARIDSQRDGATTDWRCEGGRGRGNLAAAVLPGEVAQRCVRLCAALDLDFGCIDLVADGDGDYVFLEVNQSGQFLFNELADPSLPMLDAFCRYLAGLPDGAGARVTLRAYLESDAGRADEAAYQHQLADQLKERGRTRTAVRSEP